MCRMEVILRRDARTVTRTVRRSDRQCWRARSSMSSAPVRGSPRRGVGRGRARARRRRGRRGRGGVRGRLGRVGVLGLVVLAVVLVDLLLLAGGDPSAEDVTQHVRVVGGRGGGGVAQREAARAGDSRAADDGERESSRGDGVKRGERRGGRGDRARDADRGGRGVGEGRAPTRADEQSRRRSPGP